MKYAGGAVRHGIAESYLRLYRSIHVDDAAVLPVTGAQRRFHHTVSVDSSTRRAIVVMFFSFPARSVSAGRLARAVHAVAGRNPALRVRVGPLRGLPVQRVGETDVTVEELPARRTRRQVRAVFDDWPGDAGPLRVVIAREESADLLAIAFDHMVCDEFSVGLVIEQLSRAYGTGAEVSNREAAEELDRYREAVHGQLEREKDASGPDALAHWTRRLQRAGPGRWGAGRGLNEGTGSRSDTRSLPLPPSAGRGRLFPTVLTAAHLALADHAGAAPLSYTWGGRGDEDRPVVGCFLNTVTSCPPGDEPDPYADTLAGWWDDLEYVDTPFDEVVRAARRAGTGWAGHLDLLVTLIDRSRLPVLVLDGVPGEEAYVTGMRVQAPVVLSASYDTDRLYLRLHRDEDVVPRAEADRLLETLTAAVRARLGAGT